MGAVYSLVFYTCGDFAFSFMCLLEQLMKRDHSNPSAVQCPSSNRAETTTKQTVVDCFQGCLNRFFLLTCMILAAVLIKFSTSVYLAVFFTIFISILVTVCCAAVFTLTIHILLAYCSACLPIEPADLTITISTIA